MSNYQKESNYSRQFLKGKEERKKCCDTNESDTKAPPSDLDCVEKWRKQLDTALKAMNTVSAEYDKASGIYRNAKLWEEKLKKWVEDADKTHNQVDNICGELDEFLRAVERTQAEETTASVEAVLCLVKSIFDEVTILLPNHSEEDPQGKIQALKQWIECNSDLDVNKKEKALKCITDSFEGKMQAINQTQEDLLTKLLNILHSANILAAAIDKSKNESNFGIKRQLEDLRRRISGETVYTARERWCGFNPSTQSPPVKAKPPCDDEIVNPSPLLFPIKQHAYYLDIYTLHKNAQEEEKTAKSEMDELRSKYETAKTYYNSLNDAIKASEAAKPATK